MDVLCTEHGWLSHVAVHEAAHAVIAHARGIPFVGISVTDPYALQDVLFGASVVAGGLHLTSGDYQSWIPPRADDATDMLVAGAYAEVLVYGHNLPNSDSGDLRILAQGMGWDATHLIEAREAMERSRMRLKLEIPERYPAIKRIVEELTRGLAPDEHGRYFDFDEALSLSADEIGALIDNI